MLRAWRGRSRCSRSRGCAGGLLGCCCCVSGKRGFTILWRTDLIKESVCESSEGLYWTRGGLEAMSAPHRWTLWVGVSRKIKRYIVASLLIYSLTNSCPSGTICCCFIEKLFVVSAFVAVTPCEFVSQRKMSAQKRLYKRCQCGSRIQHSS